MRQRNRGGRGHRNPWSSVVVRVPAPLVAQIHELVEGFYDGGAVSQGLPALDEAVLKARQILNSKKSARASLERLLKDLYGVSVEL